MRIGPHYIHVLRTSWSDIYGVSFGNAKRHVNVKLGSRETFSERYNYVRVFRCAGLSLSIRDKLP